MDEQNRDDYYEGPPLEEPEQWHDGALYEDPRERAQRERESVPPQPSEDAPVPVDEDDPPIEHESSSRLAEIAIPETGVYLLPEVIERPHTTDAGLAPNALTRDPSMSRAVDRAAAGLEPTAAGYDRTMEGPPPGPLEPTADEVPADSGDHPGGQYGSSG